MRGASQRHGLRLLVEGCGRDCPLRTLWWRDFLAVHIFCRKHPGLHRAESGELHEPADTSLRHGMSHIPAPHSYAVLSRSSLKLRRTA